ncbi:MAG: TFIIB-type zinc ribbon-containing protein [Firmicutes bacterium]|nr:TFIIB-type zinc ribbon-containing protein [Bacillota bacterium]
MKKLNCKNCGGTMAVDPSGAQALCPYCGTRYVLDHRDTDYYLDFYKTMRGFLSLSNDDKLRRRRADELWEGADQTLFETRDGKKIDVRSMYARGDKNLTAYTARRNIILNFAAGSTENADKFRRNAALLDYPSADTRSLSDFFPEITGGYPLADGSSLLVLKKSEDEYPLRMFGKLSGRHTAWLIGRLENLCCVLEYNSLVHPDICEDTLYIDPYTHQASLYLGWEKVVKNNTKGLTTTLNLVRLRETAARVLGFENTDAVQPTDDIPAPFADFLKSAPKATAYDDFAYWDEVLIKSYGERKFITMDTDDEKIYKEGD